MSARARRAALLAVVAAVLLVNPLYVGAVLDDGGSSRAATVYTATAVDPGNESDHDALLRAVGENDVVELDSLAKANEYAFYGDEYRAPSEAARVLERAVQTGAANATGDAAFTLRRVGANYRYAVAGDEQQGPYYRINATASNGTTTITAERVSDEAVREFLVHRDAVLYTALPEYERDAYGTAIAAEDGYRPPDADTFDGVRGRVVVKGDAYYVLREVAHVDDIGFSPRGAASLLLDALGALALLAAVALTALSYWDAHSASGNGTS